MGKRVRLHHTSGDLRASPLLDHRSKAGSEPYLEFSDISQCRCLIALAMLGKLRLVDDAVELEDFHHCQDPHLASSDWLPKLCSPHQESEHACPTPVNAALVDGPSSRFRLESTPRSDLSVSSLQSQLLLAFQTKVELFVFVMIRVICRSVPPHRGRGIPDLLNPLARVRRPWLIAMRSQYLA
jgi:hypothetical protein